MRRMWDALGGIAVAALVIVMLMNMIRPYIGWLLLAAVIIYGGTYVVTRLKGW